MTLQQLAQPSRSDESPSKPIETARPPSRSLDCVLRLRLSPSIGRGALDGAWWPYSRDLATEAVHLADHFPAGFARIFRIVYSTPDWEPSPRRVKAAAGFVNLGSFPRDDTHLVMLRSVATGGQPVPDLLLVVPPDIENRAAQHAMRLACMPSNLKSAAAILTESQDQQRVSELAHWDDDGGRSRNA